ncbi:MAG: undecaprenyl-phosphate glucose phosphotransferase [Calditrichaeota bacterium]|nr:MAG: undecaprenyl-phosphate glucose phosphotransferase [Calditrichota bacterium]
MHKNLEKTFLLLVDFVAINLTFFAWAWLRQEMGFFSESQPNTLFYFSLLIYLYWLLVFSFFGMYGSWYAQSRVDEFITIFKTISFGVFIIFILTFDFERDLASPPKSSRMFIINYWLLLILFVTSARLILRTIQRALLTSGIGLRRTLIVGWSKKGWKLSDDILKFPALGYKVVGFVSETPQSKGKVYHNIPLLGSIHEIADIIKRQRAQEIIFALKGTSRKKMLDILDQCNGFPINFKIMPDLYDIVMGQARTNQIYGFPLIDIMPQIMPVWEQKFKRLMDIVVSLVILLAFLPLWLLIAVAIKLDSPGPVFYKQQRVGKDGKEFTMYKFRSMIHNAESRTGPRWAQKDDPRVTRVGKIIRKLRLDEVPQFYNVLKGEMSLIGPRPERPYFVKQFKKTIPFYVRRLRVQPGITGWAQIKGEYDTSIENVKKKLQYDLFYLENMSLRMDLKILLSTIYTVLRGKGL